MTNITNNRISQEVTVEAVEKVNLAIRVIYENLPFLIGLTKEERKKLPKIYKDNKEFVQDVLDAMKDNQHLVPPYISYEEINKDFTLYKKLNDISFALAQLAEKTSDTQMLAGSEAYSSALMFYKMAQLAAQAGMPGADTIYDKLKERFKGQGRNTTTNVTTVEETKTTE